MSAQNEQLFGRVAVASKAVSAQQLQQALDAQKSSPGKDLGEVMLELGFLYESTLKRVLQLQTQVVEKAKAKSQGGAAPASAAPKPSIAPKPSVAAGPKESAAPESMQTEQNSLAESARPKAAAAPAPASTPDPGFADLDSLLRAAVEAGASDIHVHSGSPIKFRLRQALYDHGSGVLEKETAESLLFSAFSDADRKLFEERGEVDFCYSLEGVGRFRANVYRQLRGTDGSFRFIPDTPPSLEDLSLPSELSRFTSYHQGMVLLTGPTSSGKSSTMAALINLINRERQEHILTIEDPIEYLHTSASCVVNQRTVLRDTESFSRALRGALREDPDVIVIGELRDRETISLALSAAETGHFVLATLHTDNAIRTVNRLIGAFPPDQQEQVRSMLSESLKAVISQHLLPTADESRLVPALEVMIVNRAVGNLIREQKTVQIHSLLQTGSSQGMCLLDHSLLKLVQEGTVSRETALRVCEDPRAFQ